MIVIEDSRSKVIYCRTNRRIKWKYAEYCGRWESIADCLKSAKEHYGDQGFEYMIEDLATDAVMTGFVNWEGRK